jgi:hypothetical protein
MEKTAGLVEHSKKKMAVGDTSKLGRLLYSGAWFEIIAKGFTCGQHNSTHEIKTEGSKFSMSTP